jgi:hypothetical protein
MADDAGRPPRSVLPPLPDDAGGADVPPYEPPTQESVRPPAGPPPGGRPPRSPRSKDGRRLRPAGNALLVALLALGIGLLLNAPGIHKSAYNQPDGWKRDVATSLTGPLKDVSHALFLDRPRAALKAAIGRSDDDDIDVEIALPPTTTAPPPPSATPKPKPKPKPGGAKPKPEAPAKPRKVAFTPKKQLKLWIAGDSLVITPGYSIVRAAGASPVIDPVGEVDGRVGTGLERPDVFNWFQEVADKMKSLRPKAVVLGFGANDDHAYMTGLPEGVSIDDFGTPTWEREYRRRVGGVMDTVTRAGAHLIWIGLPLTRSPTQTQRFDRINAAVIQEVKRRKRTVTYIDTYSMFAAETGGYSDYRTNASGKVERVRAEDGVHFDVAGGNLIAREVLKRLNEVYDLTSWRRKTR